MGAVASAGAAGVVGRAAFGTPGAIGGAAVGAGAFVWLREKLSGAELQDPPGADGIAIGLMALGGGLAGALAGSLFGRAAMGAVIGAAATAGAIVYHDEKSQSDNIDAVNAADAAGAFGP